MITVMVTFPLAAGSDAASAAAIYGETAPRYRGVPGLLRKTYLYDPVRNRGGAWYLWRDRATAEAFHAGPWLAFVTGKYGAAPELAWFDSPVVVDNEADRILTAQT